MNQFYCAPGNIVSLERDATLSENIRNHNQFVIGMDDSLSGWNYIQTIALTSMFNREVKVEIPVMFRGTVSYLLPQNIISIDINDFNNFSTVTGFIRDEVGMTTTEIIRLILDMHTIIHDRSNPRREEVLMKYHEYCEWFYQMNKDKNEYRKIKNHSTTESPKFIYVPPKEIRDILQKNRPQKNSLDDFTMMKNPMEILEASVNFTTDNKKESKNNVETKPKKKPQEKKVVSKKKQTSQDSIPEKYKVLHTTHRRSRDEWWKVAEIVSSAPYYISKWTKDDILALQKIVAKFGYEEAAEMIQRWSTPDSLKQFMYVNGFVNAEVKDGLRLLQRRKQREGAKVN